MRRSWEFNLDFLVSKNEVEYEALLTRLQLAKDLDVKYIQVLCDSKVVSSQINAEFKAKEPLMASYLQVSKNLASCFDSFEVTHIPHPANLEANMLPWIGYGIDQNLAYPVVSLLYSSIDGSMVNTIEECETWMTLIIRYLENGELPLDRV